MSKQIEDQSVALIILDQLKTLKHRGFPILNYIGAKRFVAYDNMLRLYIPTQNRINNIFIYYNEGLDLYNIEFKQVVMGGTKQKPFYVKDKLRERVTEVYCDQMAEVIARVLLNE